MKKMVSFTMCSVVGLLPLAAVAIFEEKDIAKLVNFRQRAQKFGERHQELLSNMHTQVCLVGIPTGADLSGCQ